MILKRTFRFYPDERQARALAQTFGCVRYAYNFALALKSDQYKAGVKLNYCKLSAAWTKEKQAKPFLREVSCVPCQQAIRHLDVAFSNFFAKRASYPTFKSKRDSTQSASYTEGAFKLKNGQLSISKIGRINVVWSMDMAKSEPSSVTITRDASQRYHVTLTVEETKAHLPKTGVNVGVDLGITTFAALSTGEDIANPRHTKKSERKLAMAQRVMSRRVKGSGRWKRTKRRVAKVHAHLSAQRKDFLNKTTTSLVRRFDTIALEDMNVAGMLKNHKLAKHIADASWSEFRRMVAYKCEWYGKTLALMPRFQTSSKACSACGAAFNGEMNLSVREWSCACGAQHNRDTNAAKNILAGGQPVIARGGTVSPKSRKTPRQALRNVNPAALCVA